MTTYNTFNIHSAPVSITTPWVMGIINATPDSFYAESRCFSDSDVAARVWQVKHEGADIFDIGAYSTRPDATPVSEDEELERISRALHITRLLVPDAIISVDTFRASVARLAVEKYGVEIINDVSGGTLDPDMFPTIAELGPAYVLMHMRGTPQTMQSLTDYNDVVSDVITDLSGKLSALKRLGHTNVIIDPGFGFSKTLEQNYQLMKRLDEFHILEHPLLVGISRKSMIYRALGITPEKSLHGTIALNMFALEKGAKILRVHDVKEAADMINIYNRIYK